MKARILLIMIDGISSDYFLRHPHMMPNTHGLAKSGTVFTGLAAEKCGSSLPGRTAILTGRPSCEHGIYGNMIWDTEIREFRYSTPYDVRIPTLFMLARKAGLDTASIGFGMIRPEDCTLYCPPFWIGDFVSRSRDSHPVPITEGWEKGLEIVDDGRLQRAETKLGFNPEPSTARYGPDYLDEMSQDLKMVQRVNEVIASDNPPDLVFTEINVTDGVQHSYGYASNTAHVSIAYADMLVGNIIRNLHDCGKQDDYTVIVTSDHGHGNTDSAIYADRIVNGHQWSSECAILFLENRTGVDAAVTQFSQMGAREMENRFLPGDLRDQLIVLAVDDKRSFEHAPANIMGVTGSSKYVSSHSYAPGTRCDDRFAVISGHHSQLKWIENGNAEQFYSIMGELLELDL